MLKFKHMESPRATPVVPSIVGLVVALGWPFLFILLAQGAQEGLGARQDLLLLLKEWVAALIVLGILSYWERRSITSVGMRRPKWSDVGAGVGVFILMFFAVNVVSAILDAMHLRSELSDQGAIANIPLGIRVALFLTAGICEEFLFRGYAIERMTELTRSRWIGAVVPCVLFSLGHGPRYGWGAGLLAVLAVSAGLTVLYAWRRNLPVNMGIHALIDAIGLFVVPSVVHH